MPSHILMSYVEVDIVIVTRISDMFDVSVLGEKHSDLNLTRDLIIDTV